MKQKWICALLAASMALSLCACTADKPAEPTPTPAGRANAAHPLKKAVRLF